jgi:hypothetical protein
MLLLASLVFDAQCGVSKRAAMRMMVCFMVRISYTPYGAGRDDHAQLHFGQEEQW